MQVKSLALGGAAIVVVGGALAGGYYFGQNRQATSPQPMTQAQAPSNAAPSNYPDQQQGPQSPSSEQSSPMPQGYESAQFSSQPRFGSTRHRQGARHPVDYAYFHDQLNRYGRWQYSDRWGQVWQPSEVDADFRPYDRGHWVNTREFGWTWDSDYEWGSIPFHYGRWVDDPERGWLWIPGYVWGPGWVVWRSNGHYTGWMPMPPDRGFIRGDETYRNDWHEQGDYGYRDWYGPQYDENRTTSLWVFVDTGHMADRDYHRYQVTRPDEVKQVYSQTTNVTNYTTVNNYVVNQSIDVRAVEQASGHKVEAVPAVAVVKKPDLVTPVSEGKQAQIEARQEVPVGQGKPNSAPPITQTPNGAPPPGSAGQQTGAKSAQSPSTAPQTAPNTSGPSQATNNGASTASPNAGEKASVAERHLRPFERPENAQAGAAQNNGSKSANEAKQEGGPKAVTSGEAPQTGATGAAPETAREDKRHRGFERAQGLSQISPKEAASPGSAPPAAGENAQSVTPPKSMGEMKRHRPFEREQALSQASPSTGNSQTGGPSANSENAQSAPPSATGEMKRHRPFERQQGVSQATPNEGRPENGGAPAASGPNAEPNAVGSNENQGPFRRRHGTTEGPNSPQGSENANSQSPQGGGFPRGAENGAAANADNGGTTTEPPRKRKLVVPAATEPGANSQKSSQPEPGTDVRTQAPPSGSNTNEESPKPHKGRHKSDEPGGDENGPPPQQ